MTATLGRGRTAAHVRCAAAASSSGTRGEQEAANASLPTAVVTPSVLNILGGFSVAGHLGIECLSRAHGDGGFDSGGNSSGCAGAATAAVASYQGHINSCDGRRDDELVLASNGETFRDGSASRGKRGKPKRNGYARTGHADAKPVPGSHRVTLAPEVVVPT